MFDDRSFKAKKGFSSLIIITFDFFSMFNCDMSRFNKDFCYKTDFSSDDYTLVEPLCFSKMEERNSSGGRKRKKSFEGINFLHALLSTIAAAATIVF